MNWDKRDAAAYVVSTMNLLYTKRGKAVTTVLSRQLGIARYDVYQDSASTYLYFIQFRNADGVVAGAVAYQMGWAKPQSVTVTADKLGIRRASDKAIEAFKSDPKELIGSFTTTLPS